MYKCVKLVTALKLNFDASCQVAISILTYSRDVFSQMNGAAFCECDEISKADAA